MNLIFTFYQKYRTTYSNNKNDPELVVSYDTRPGDNVGLFYQYQAPPNITYLN